MTGVKKLVSLVETGGNGLLLEKTFFFYSFSPITIYSHD